MGLARPQAVLPSQYRPRTSTAQAARLLFEAAGVMSEIQETGPVDRRVQFIIVAPGASLGLPTEDNQTLTEPSTLALIDSDAASETET